MTQPRTCGECTLCCRLVPVSEGFTHEGKKLFSIFEKEAGVRCEHQRHHKGCAIYERRPMACRKWSCHWLTGKDTEGLSRPDRSHYVIDPCLDYVRMKNKKTGEETKLPVIQVWIDPHFPKAFDDDALRALLERRRMAALCRYNSKDAFLLIPPCHSSDGKWHAWESNNCMEMQHSPEEIMEAIEASTGELNITY